jgi:glutamate-1-semialdehyde aminotransferase
VNGSFSSGRRDPGITLPKLWCPSFVGVEADLHTFAKAMANGFPIAAFAGKKELMSMVKPGGLFHGGTYAGNPPSLAATYATLNELTKPRNSKRDNGTCKPQLSKRF